MATRGREVRQTADAFADRIDTFSGGIDAFPGGIDAFPGGIDAFLGGIDAFPGGIDAFRGGIDAFRGGIDAFAEGIDAFRDGIDERFGTAAPNLSRRRAYQVKLRTIDVARANHARAHQGADLAGRKGRPAWVRPFRRMHRALDSSMRLIGSSLRTAVDSHACAHRRPVRSSQTLYAASGRLITASERLVRAAQELIATMACLGPESDGDADLPQRLILATVQCAAMTQCLQQAADGVFALHADVLDGLLSGELVPEHPSNSRPRIVLAPRPVPVRAFLRARQPRVADRITPVLQRRRRTPRPAALSVPPRTSQGRAPPLSPVCLL